MAKHFHIIAAIDQNQGIGYQGTIPWQCSQDLIYFKKLTTQVSSQHKKNACIMGRKTWESLPEKFKPLPNRLNIILTTSQTYPHPENVLLFSNFDQVLQVLNQKPYSSEIENIFVIGGEQLYKEAINNPSCHKLYLTHIKAQFPCDSFFPNYQAFTQEIHHSPIYTENNLSFYFSIYQKIA
jgi:dihydrofolate reductase